MSQIIYLDLVYNTFERIGLSPTQISLHNYILPLVTSILVFLVVCNFQYLHHDIFEISRACIAFCTHSHVLNEIIAQSLLYNPILGSGQTIEHDLVFLRNRTVTEECGTFLGLRLIR
jgi:hypothetical protein